jgi:NAD(P)H-hydrate epimerase
MKIVTVDQMKDIEKKANDAGFSYQKMMQNAGHGIAKFILLNRQEHNDSSITIGLVGPGNNGGDTLIALRELAENGINSIAFCYKRNIDQDTLCNELLTRGGKVFQIEKLLLEDVLASSGNAHVYLLDGFLGTGFHLPIEAELKEFLTYLNSTINRDKTTIIAIDCPSGVDCNTGDVDTSTIRADHTMCMEAIKKGLLSFPAFDYIGQLHTLNIGIDEILTGWKEDLPGVICSDNVVRRLPTRSNNSHKGSFGKVLVIGGSINYCGSVLLSAEAAYRSGSGLVTLGVTEPVYSVIAGQLPEATWILLPDEMGCIIERAVKIINDTISIYDCLLIGPGLSVNESTKRFILNLIGSFNLKPKHKMGFISEKEYVGDKETYAPRMVIDADGLKCLHEIPLWWKQMPEDVVITPHPGEMSILTGIPVTEVQNNRMETARKYASKWNLTIVLKGALTVVADPDGNVMVLPFADSALAHAGTGDVLAGMVASYMGQGLACFDAAVLACYLHARAGMKARETVGDSAAVLSREIIQSIGACIQELHTKK